jgi:hypothetical protein
VICLGVASVAQAADGMTIRWTNNMLTISNPELPGGKVDIWYLEAFCRSGSTHRSWNQTTIPHKTELMEADQKGKHLRLRTLVEPGIEGVREMLDVVSDRLPHLMRGLHDSVYSPERLQTTADSFASFYKTLTESGIPD